MAHDKSVERMEVGLNSLQTSIHSAGARRDRQDEEIEKQGEQLDLLEEKTDQLILELVPLKGLNPVAAKRGERWDQEVVDLGGVKARLGRVETSVDFRVLRLDSVISNIRVPLPENLLVVVNGWKQTLDADTQCEIIGVLDRLLTGLARENKL